MRTAPTPNDMSEVVRMRRLEKIHSGSTGSAARRSMSTNATRSTAATEKAPMLCHEFHAQAWPPSSTGEDQQREAHGEDDGAGDVDPVLRRCTVSW